MSNIYDEVKVITHEEARNIIDIDYDVLSEHYDCEKSKKEINVEKQKVLDYITQQQAKDKVHEELVRDVKRYFELDNKHGCTLRDIDEWLDLERKLMKVGKEDV